MSWLSLFQQDKMTQGNFVLYAKPCCHLFQILLLLFRYVHLSFLLLALNFSTLYYFIFLLIQ